MQDVQLNSDKSFGFLSDAEKIDDHFEQLRRVVYREIDKKDSQSGRLTLFRECGVLHAKCRYFFIQSPGDIGKLFERSGRGWIVSFCERIRGQDLFIRRGEPIETVVLQNPENGAASPRVISSEDENMAVSFRLYVKKVVDQFVYESF